MHKQIFFLPFFIFHSFPVLVPVNLSPPFLTVQEMGITRFRLASVHQCEVASTPHSELYTDLPRSQWWVWCIFAYNLKGTQKNTPKQQTKEKPTKKPPNLTRQILAYPWQLRQAAVTELSSLMKTSDSVKVNLKIWQYEKILLCTSACFKSCLWKAGVRAEVKTVTEESGILAWRTGSAQPVLIHHQRKK